MKMNKNQNSKKSEAKAQVTSENSQNKAENKK